MCITVVVIEINVDLLLPFKCCCSFVCFIFNGFLMSVYLLFGALKAIKLQQEIADDEDIKGAYADM